MTPVELDRLNQAKRKALAEWEQLAAESNTIRALLRRANRRTADAHRVLEAARLAYLEAAGL